MLCEKCNDTGIKNISELQEIEYCDCTIYCSIRECNGWYYGICRKQPATICMRKNNKVL